MRTLKSIALCTVVCLCLVTLIAGCGKVELAKERAQSQNNIKQMLLSIHNDASVNGDRLVAPSITDQDGKPLLSWRVALLPYIEQTNLYKQFRLDEPWDSPHNKALLQYMPSTYRARHQSETDTTTYYQLVVGKGSAFDPTSTEPLTLSKLMREGDGTSTTIFVVEAANAVPWTKPEDVNIDGGAVLSKLGGVLGEGNGFNVGMGDGSVRFIPSDVSEQELLHAIQWKDGKVGNLDGE